MLNTWNCGERYFYDSSLILSCVFRYIFLYNLFACEINNKVRYSDEELSRKSGVLEAPYLFNVKTNVVLSLKIVRGLNLLKKITKKYKRENKRQNQAFPEEIFQKCKYKN